MAALKKQQPRPKLLPPVHANKGAEVIYRKRLRKLVEDMTASVKYFVEAAYRANEPVIAQDELPARVLQRVVARLGRRWQKRFDEAAPLLAEYFSKGASKRSSKAIEKVLNEGGFSVKFKMTKTMRDVMRGSINEQVSLIRSIPKKYFTEIEGAVMRSVTAGRDLGPLAKQLQTQYGVTQRRAALIARDQNNKMTANFVRVRQQELGVSKAIWMHSHGGKQPRPRHLAFDGQEFDVAKGAPVGDDDGNFVHPGEEINCRCVSRAIVPGF